jgi:hypothetical protein
VIQIQATFAGYAGGARTLFSAYDPASRVLVVAKDAEYREDRRKGCVLLTNIEGIPHDSLFAMNDLRDAIDAYYALKNGVAADGKGARLVFDPTVLRASPEAVIERDGIDDRGPKYRIADTISCVQLAVLVTCWHAMKSDAVERTVKLAKRFERLALGEILTF